MAFRKQEDGFLNKTCSKRVARGLFGSLYLTTEMADRSHVTDWSVMHTNTFLSKKNFVLASSDGLALVDGFNLTFFVRVNSY